jgi:hypothetical protein
MLHKNVQVHSLATIFPARPFCLLTGEEYGVTAALLTVPLRRSKQLDVFQGKWRPPGVRVCVCVCV